ncbi:hypothetical protein ALI22I_27900 [Saccharothrix sp. ALI-22-I]|uniref:hypothetical protein n=1 Tax=Saccharothrix sp. ALI-22-I TaxID=1933778 RepID=UPI00097BFAA4|nr:hypothetical protein [Saccharothrix sp. ALI-22-I]ONI85604.1 hypothetical protein ALI22I_27900 [Saccharothrix sp. ALI-22-I]
MPTEKERLDEVEPTVADLVATTQALTAELGRVSARLLVLERRLSGAGSGPDEDLDAVEGITETVNALRAAWDAEQELLADSVRAELSAEVTEYESLREQLNAGLAKLSSGRMPRFERDALQHEVQNLEWRVNAQESGAMAAAERLDADQLAAETPWRAEAVMAGDKARLEIQDIARHRLNRALAADTRLPLWFRVGLGEITAPDPSRWVEAAVALVAYRLEYGVTDPISPLGEIPSAASGFAAWVRRAEAHTDIVDQLESLRP